jgi:beta-aspartyl-peptidase (threonine type)
VHARHSDGCLLAAHRAREALERGADAFEAARIATEVLEDDPRYNAGTGSNLRLDGRLIQMDAAVMASDGRFGGVACIERVQHPIAVAAAVTRTPHLLLVGEGATAFARRLGFEDYDPVTDGARDKLARAMADLHGRGSGDFDEDAAPWRSLAIDAVWNYDAAWRAEGAADCDTVGAVVRDAAGGFCATASTGGTVFMLRGRVGDSPLIGCGLFAGPAGAVAATGVGEEIARRVLSKAVYDELARGAGCEDAARRAVEAFDPAVDVGLLVTSGEGLAIVANRDMACATLTPTSERVGGALLAR